MAGEEREALRQKLFEESQRVAVMMIEGELREKPKKRKLEVNIDSLIAYLQGEPWKGWKWPKKKSET